MSVDVKCQGARATDRGVIWRIQLARGLTMRRGKDSEDRMREICWCGVRDTLRGSLRGRRTRVETSTFPSRYVQIY